MTFHLSPLITWTEKGLFCEAGGFYIDPHRAVDTALITHAHSDHARRGSKQYICVTSGLSLLKARLGHKIVASSYAYGEVFHFGEVAVSFHSAGHILGSAQVRVQRGEEVWVASGDYKRDHDPSCEPFESIKCDTFITEATFGTPRFIWEKNLEHGRMIHEWIMSDRTRNCILFGYSLGKAQRILAELAPFMERPVLIHETIFELTECYRREGRTMASTELLSKKITSGEVIEGELILAPPSILTEGWIERIGRYETAFASGWMQGKGWGRAKYDKGFVMSDHADWNDINRTIEETGARRVFVQHRDGALVRHLRNKGIEAHSIDELRPRQYAPGENLILI
ncbi:MAG TPA: ligase-associated DNA damage response exonuclease [Bacteriovoracaceae bacterium]|nr:ligase-associated DNA damage response exonuclease [Bacteriovoracaceae bacterium]